MKDAEGFCLLKYFSWEIKDQGLKIDIVLKYKISYRGVRIQWNLVEWGILCNFVAVFPEPCKNPGNINKFKL